MADENDDHDYIKEKGVLNDKGQRETEYVKRQVQSEEAEKRSRAKERILFEQMQRDMEEKHISPEEYSSKHSKDLSAPQSRIDKMREHQEKLYKIHNRIDPETSYKERTGQWYYERSPQFQEDQEYKRRQIEEKNKIKAKNNENRLGLYIQNIKSKAAKPKYERRETIGIPEVIDDEFSHERQRLRDLSERKRKPSFDNSRGMLGDGKSSFAPVVTKIKGIFDQEPKYKENERILRAKEGKGFIQDMGFYDEKSGPGKKIDDYVKMNYEGSFIRPEGSPHDTYYDKKLRALKNAKYEGVIRESEKQAIKEKIDKIDKFYQYYKTNKKIKAADKWADNKERIQNEFNNAKLGIYISDNEMDNINSIKEWNNYLKLLKSGLKTSNKMNMHDYDKEKTLIDEYVSGAKIGGFKTNQDKYFNPILGGASETLRGGSELLTQNVVTKKVQSILNRVDDAYLIKNGADESDIIQLRLLEDRYEQAKYNNDLGLKKELELNIIAKKSRINKKILSAKRIEGTEKRKIMTEQLNIKKLEREIENIGASKTGATKTKKEVLPKEFDYRNQGKRANGIPFHPSRNSVSFENAAGFARPNVMVPSFAGYGLNRFNNQADMAMFARNRIAQNQQDEFQYQQMKKLEDQKRDAKLANTFMRVDRLHMMISGNGALPEKANLHNLPATVHKNKNVNPVSRMGMVTLAIPKVNLTLSSQGNRRVPAVKKKVGGMIVPSPIKNKINTSSRIAMGIENMVAPHRQMAQVHKDKFYHSPECAIANICGNVRSTATAHKNHVAEFKNINLGIGVIGGGHNFGLPSPVKHSVKKPNPMMGTNVVMPTINLTGKLLAKRKKKGKR
jgi:hypothetical protein